MPQLRLTRLKEGHTKSLASLLKQVTETEFHPLPPLTVEEATAQAEEWCKADQSRKEKHYLLFKEGDDDVVLAHFGIWVMHNQANHNRPPLIADTIVHWNRELISTGEQAAGLRCFLDIVFEEPLQEGLAGYIATSGLDQESTILRNNESADNSSLLLVEAVHKLFDSNSSLKPHRDISCVKVIVHEEDETLQQLLKLIETSYTTTKAGEGPQVIISIRKTGATSAQFDVSRLSSLDPGLASMRVPRSAIPPAIEIKSTPLGEARPGESPMPQEPLVFEMKHIDFASEAEFEELLHQRQLCGWTNTVEALRSWQDSCNKTGISKESYWIYIPSTGRNAGHVSYEVLSSGTDVHISQLFVLPDHRKGGLARRVMDTLEARARSLPKVKAVLLDTFPRDYWYTNKLDRAGTWWSLGLSGPRPGRQICNEDWYRRRGYVAYNWRLLYPGDLITGARIKLGSVALRLDLGKD